MKSTGEYKRVQRNNNLKWSCMAIYALLLLLVLPGAQISSGWKEFLVILTIFLGAVLLLDEQPKRIFLTILGYAMLVFAGVLTVLALL